MTDKASNLDCPQLSEIQEEAGKLAVLCNVKLLLCLHFQLMLLFCTAGLNKVVIYYMITSMGFAAMSECGGLPVTQASPAHSFP